MFREMKKMINDLYFLTGGSVLSTSYDARHAMGVPPPLCRAIIKPLALLQA